ncbi:uncharacterized protein LOC106011734 [Aplysia californica]|uniref:Uncharacterized protein LOC106011734 n=1 Tax=Aplysia californica TaxID=6500 RepID=A0ABM1VTB7_APLCA|nr:uncharacterized protein LOC106011734 [Aplysia californica]
MGKTSSEIGHQRPEQKLPEEETIIERSAERNTPVEVPGIELRDQPKQPSTEVSDAFGISTEPSEPGPSERKQPTKTPAQDQIKKELSRINSEILYIMNIKSSCGLSTDLKKTLKSSEKEKEELEKKLKRKLTDAKAQATARRKKVAKLESLLNEAGEKIKHTHGKPRLEENMEGLAEAIYSIVVPEGAADERRRTETMNTIKTLDDLKGALEERGYILSRSALYYRLIPANVRSIDGKHHFSTVNIKLCRPQNNQRKPHVDGHFATASVKYVKELASLFGGDNVFFLVSRRQG